jgi:LAO/AO transport system kinase
MSAGTSEGGASIDPEAQARAERVRGGDVRTAARLMRDLDDRMPGAVDALAALYPHTGHAYVIGVTGNPGAGKSTVVDRLIEKYRAAGHRVGVVAVDPTSPYSGGAILGDRIRMQRHATDPGVFIRSLATRGHLGGLSRSTGEVIAVLDAMGFDEVIVETVGVGQDEVDVVELAHTAVVVTVPGLGDDVQALKAGILEIADVLVVNKADREGADRTLRDLTGMLELRPMNAPEVEIVRTVATNGEGLDRLLEAIARHRQRSQTQVSERARRRARAQLEGGLLPLLLNAVDRELERRGGAAAVLDALIRRERDPFTLAAELAQTILRP